MFFRIKSKLVPTIRKNFSSKYRKMGQPLTCPSCSQMNESLTSRSTTGEQGETSPVPLHSQTHILYDCEYVSDLRNDCDPEDDQSLVDFFTKVVARNMELEDNMDNLRGKPN